MLSRLFIAALWSPDFLALVCYIKLCFCHFPKWYPGAGVVLNCIYSLSLLLFLLSVYCTSALSRSLLQFYADSLNIFKVFRSSSEYVVMVWI